MWLICVAAPLHRWSRCIVTKARQLSCAINDAASLCQQCATCTVVNAVNRVEAWRPHGGRRVCDTVTGMSYDVKAKGSCDSVEMSCGTLVGLGAWGER